MEYNPRAIELKWKKYWEENKVFKVENPVPGFPAKPKYYVLDMFPYPSGAGLHVGHPLGYIASDIFSRYKRMNGFNVLHPMGFDAFGLPAEQYAIQTGIHPAVSTDNNIKRYREQLENLGLSFDWDRQVKTSDPDYYKWTQWIFLMLFGHYYDSDAQKAMPVEALIRAFEKNGNLSVNATNSHSGKFTADEWKAMTPKQKDDVLMNYRLAYRKLGQVNWCEALGTVLANDEVKDGVSERGGHPVEQRPMLQWSLRITAYAERLLNDLELVDFSDALKAMQRNWIGRSEGAQLFFEVENNPAKEDVGTKPARTSPYQPDCVMRAGATGGRVTQSGWIEIFTTRPDTIFGATFMVLAPEHPMVAALTTPEKQATIDAYLKYVNTRTTRDRMTEVKEVTGAFTGSYAINPFTKTRIPIWIAEYVLLEYGTGAIMAVPSDDERDHAFATKFELPIVKVVDKTEYPEAGLHQPDSVRRAGDKVGTLINSDFLNGMQVPDAIEAITRKIEDMQLGQRRVNYKLKDANFSRQRYWGEPFPIKYDKNGVAHPLSFDQLPLQLPEMEDISPGKDGKSPLAKNEEWVNSEKGFTYETDTMPGYAGSSWYFLRYMDAANDKEPVGQDAVNYWRDVDLYVGGTEHAVGHLMYARFWHKFLFDKGIVPSVEPFKKLVNQGMIQGRSLIMQVFGTENVEAYREIHVPVEFADEHDRLYLDKFEILKNSINKFEDVELVSAKPSSSKTRPIRDGRAGSYVIKSFDEDGMEYIQVYPLIEKMSKSKFNVVNPDDVVEKYGADCFRMYEMFLGPIEQSKPWDTNGIEGVSKFLRKFWNLFFDKNGNFSLSDEEPSKEALKVLHTAIKKVSEDIERFSFNTCVSAFMMAVNDLKRIDCNNRKILEQLVCLLAPFAPHIAEEMWERLGHSRLGGSIIDVPFPKFNEEYLKEDSIKYPIAINGKTRAFANFPADASNDEIEKAAVEMEDIQKWTEGKSVRKVIVVPNRMVNIVVG